MVQLRSPSQLQNRTKTNTTPWDRGRPSPSLAGESPKDNFGDEHPNRIFYPNSPADGKPQTALPKKSLAKRFFLPKTGRGSHVVGE
jgi:hypothetical protein